MRLCLNCDRDGGGDDFIDGTGVDGVVCGGGFFIAQKLLQVCSYQTVS